MTPETIPWLLCGAVCLLPLLVGVTAFFALVTITNRNPSMDVSNWKDEEGRKHIHAELVMLTREEKKFRNQPEEDEA